MVPALREWSGGSGTFELGGQSRIVVESRALAGDAELLRDALAAVSGLDVRVVDSAPARAGDVVLARASGLGREGYNLEIGDRVTIAGTEAGVFYGAQTVLQILRATPGHRTLPRGEARDWPRFRERGYLLDVGGQSATFGSASAHTRPATAPRARPSLPGARGSRSVGPGRSVSARWQVDVPLAAAAGDYHLVAHAVHADGRAGALPARRSARRSTRSSTPNSPRSTGARRSRRGCGSRTTPPAR